MYREVVVWAKKTIEFIIVFVVCPESEVLHIEYGEGVYPHTVVWLVWSMC